MTMIVPAGKNKLDWIPSVSEGLKKTASVNSDEDTGSSLYDIAKRVVEADCAVCGAKDGEGSSEVSKEDEVVVIETDGVDGEVANEVANEVVEEVSEEVPEEVEIELEVEEDVGEVVDTVEEAVEKVEEAVSELKEVVTDGEVAEDGVCEDVAKCEETEECNEVKEFDIPGEKEVDGDVVVETCMASEDNKMKKNTASFEQFIPIASISKKNKAELKKYWVEYLGFPKDYVDLMIQD